MLTGNEYNWVQGIQAPQGLPGAGEGQSAREERLLLQEGWTGRGLESCRGRTPSLICHLSHHTPSHHTEQHVLPQILHCHVLLPLPPLSSSEAILSFPTQPSPPAAPSPGQAASAFCVPMICSASRDQGLLDWKLTEPRDWIYPSVYSQA